MKGRNMVEVKRVINAFLIFGVLMFIIAFFRNPTSASEWGGASSIPIIAALVYYYSGRTGVPVRYCSNCGKIIVPGNVKCGWCDTPIEKKTPKF